MNKIAKYGCFGVLGLGLILLISFPILFKQAFGPIEEIINIKQQIGGELICESTYSADLQSSYYFINFKYKKENGEIVDIGNGSYFGRDWNKDDQLKKIGNWLILKTGGEYDSDKLLIGKSDSKQWGFFEISPAEIQKDKLWIDQKIHLNRKGTQGDSFIKEIKGDKIKVEYSYLAGEGNGFQQTRILTYKFNEEIGLPKIIKIELK